MEYKKALHLKCGKVNVIFKRLSCIIKTRSIRQMNEVVNGFFNVVSGLNLTNNREITIIAFTKLNTYNDSSLIDVST